jgi:ribosomal protein S18 acetylase RimI-like enzyme
MDGMTIEIRTFTGQDRDSLHHLFREAGRGAPGASLWGHEESEAAIYLEPYMDLEPESLLVAVVDEQMVGYLTGCLDTARFPTESERMDRAIKDHRLFLRPKPMVFFMRSMLDIASARMRHRSTVGDFSDARWPAHLHINVVPHVRGTGVAPELLGRWLDRLTEAGSPGCHLQTLVENTRAVSFFERMGFTKHGPTPLVPGIRRHGQRLHQQTMVRP